MANILTIITYPFYPPIGGGPLRCFYILREMARKHSVYILTPQKPEDFTQNFLPPFPKNINVISIYKSKMYETFFNFLPAKIANAINFRVLNRSFEGATDTSLLQIYPTLNTILDEVKFEVVYYENLEALSLLGKIINFKSPSSIKVYDAHNVDSELWMQKALSENKVLYKEYAEKAFLTEQSLYKKVDAFFCCSKQDNEKLTKINKNTIIGTVIPNGVDTDINHFDTNADKFVNNSIIFCGSLDYFPNKEGLLWFYNNVFFLLKEKLPSIRLTIIGNVTNNNDYQFLKNDPAINFVGKIESVVPYYHKSSVSIVPLKSGSGTRLKILEAMSLGNPVVSTFIGAEGIDYVDKKHLLIADEPATFVSSVLSLMHDKSLFNEIRLNALELVKSSYDWKKIGKKINQALDEAVIKKKGGKS